MEDTQFAFPEPLAGAIEPFARGFGLNPSVALLVLLQMAGAIAGPTVQVQTPDLSDLTPAFDLGCIQEGRAMLPGAVLAAFGGARQEIEDAIASQETADRRQWIEKMRELESLNSTLTAEVRQKEEVAAGHHPPIHARGIMEEISAEARQSGDMIRCRKELPQLRGNLEHVQTRLVDSILAVHTGVIRKGNDWNGFADAGRHSLDGHFIQIAGAGPLLAETRSKSNSLKACTELLQRSQSESPISGFDLKDNGYRACLHLFGRSDEFSVLLRHPRIKTLGLLNSFIYCAADAEVPADADALADFGNCGWHEFIARQFRLRATGSRVPLMFDRDGTVAYFAFREWCREFTSQLAVGKRVHFLRWPELMVRIATVLAVIAEDADGKILKLPHFEAAAAFLKNYAGEQAAVLETLLHRKPAIARPDNGVERLVHRLRAKGPQTRRELARGIHGQDYNVIDASLFEAIRLGLVIQSGGRYCATSVNVNPSTEPDATENGGTVAA